MLSALLLASLVLPALGGLLRRPRAVVAATFAALGCAVAVAVAVAAAGPVSASVAGSPLLGATADRLTVTFLLLVVGVSAVVQSFARRYLLGQPERRRFAAAAGMTTSATALLATSTTLIGAAVGWTVAGAGVVALLGLNGGLPAARVGVSRTVVRFAVADAALWSAVVVATVAWGTVELGPAAAPFPGTGPLATLVAVLLVVAAAGRSAQVPLHGWLPTTLAAPTPVSALLHAGVVNGGGILLIRLAPVVGASDAAMVAAFALGALTLVVGTVSMLVRPDVKGSLVYSTIGQMGFMIMTCGLGAYAAAAFHLVAHGLYKATLFLGSGGAVQAHARRGAQPPAPSRAPGAGERAAAALAPALGLAGAAWLLAPAIVADTGVALLLVFAWATGAWAARALLRRRTTALGRASAVAAIAAASAASVALVAAFTRWVDPALPVPGDAPARAWLLASVILTLAALAGARALPGSGRLDDARRALYVAVLTAAHVGPRRPPAAQAARARRRVGGLATNSEAGAP